MELLCLSNEFSWQAHRGKWVLSCPQYQERWFSSTKDYGSEPVKPGCRTSILHAEGSRFASRFNSSDFQGGLGKTSLSFLESTGCQCRQHWTRLGKYCIRHVFLHESLHTKLPVLYTVSGQCDILTNSKWNTKSFSGAFKYEFISYFLMGKNPCT